MCRPFFDDFWNGVVREKIVLRIGAVLHVVDTGFVPCVEFADFILTRHEMLVVFRTIVVGSFGEYFGEWAGPVVLSVAVAQGS